MRYDFFHEKPPEIEHARVSALARIYAAQVAKTRSEPPGPEEFTDAFEPDEAILARIPRKIADEIRCQLGDDNSYNYVRQAVRRYFGDARDAAREKSLGALLVEMRGRTAARHPKIVAQQLPKRVELGPDLQAAVADVAFDLTSDRRLQAKVESDSTPHTRVDVDGMPRGTSVRLGTKGLYVCGPGFENFVGPVPPDKTPTGPNPKITMALEHAIRGLVRESIDSRGRGFLRLTKAPVSSVDGLPCIKVDHDSLMTSRRRAYLVGGHLYASLEARPEPMWFYIGELPRKVESLTEFKPEFPATDDALTYLQDHPVGAPPPRIPSPMKRDGATTVAPIDSSLSDYLVKIGRAQPDFDGQGPTIREALGKLRDAGVPAISLFCANTIAEPWAAIQASLRAISRLYDNIGPSFLQSMATLGRASVVDSNGSPVVLILRGGLADTAEVGTSESGTNIPAIEINLESDPPKLRHRHMQPATKSISLSADDAERMTRELIESYSDEGPLELAFTYSGIFQGDAKPDDVLSTIKPVIDRALTLGLIDDYRPAETGHGYVLTIPETRYELPA